MNQTLELQHARGTCAIHVGEGGLDRVAEWVPEIGRAGRAFVIADQRVEDTHAAAVRAGLEAKGIAVAGATVAAREPDKSPETVMRLHRAMAAARVERSTPVVAVGGGITGDVAGFAAATWLRGVAVVQVPTTLLAMVDAAIGGKTGVNLSLPAGGLRKNMIGAFWQPLAVVSDPRTLATLDPRDLRCGLAECIKHGLIADPDLLAMIREDRAAILAAEPAACGRLVTAAARTKIRTVEADEREEGVRAHLNLGHTFAHAIEALDGEVRHGEAVAIGLVAAARTSVRLGRLDAEAPAMLESLLASVELPTRLPRPLATAALMEAMGLDKKVRDGRVRLVLVGPIGRCEVRADVDHAIVRAAWSDLGAT